MSNWIAGILIPIAASSALAVCAQSQCVDPGDSLVAEGIPPIPIQLARELDRYTEARSATMSSWHPIERHMLISTRIGDVPQVYLVKSPGEVPLPLTEFTDSVAAARFHPTHGRSLLLLKDSAGDERYQLYHFDIASRSAELLTDGTSRNGPGVWSNGGNQFVYASNRRSEADLDLWIGHPDDPASHRLLAEFNGGGWSPIEFSPDDQWSLVDEYISFNESHLWGINVKNGERRRVTPAPNTPVRYGQAQFSRDGKGLYVTTNRDSEFLRLAYVDLQTTEHTFLTEHIPWDVSLFQLSWDGKTLAFVANEDGISVLHLLDTVTGTQRPANLRLGSGVIFSIEWHRNNRDLGFSFASPRRNTNAYALDTHTNTAHQWTFSETGGIRTDAFSDAEIVRWKSFDGRMIPGLLYKPPARFTGKRPVIINIHGGPEGQAQPLFVARNSYIVNEMGIAIIEPNVRGSTGYGKTYASLDNGFLRHDACKDIGALLDWIKAQPQLDSDRVGLMGTSYGGYLALAAAGEFTDRICCVIDQHGISNIVSFLENLPPHRQDLRRAEFGDERDPILREYLTRIAPRTNAARLTKPLLVIHGANDTRVRVNEAESLLGPLRDHGTPVWYLLAKNEGHGFRNETNVRFEFYATVAFIQKHLLGLE